MHKDHTFDPRRSGRKGCKEGPPPRNKGKFFEPNKVSTKNLLKVELTKWHPNCRFTLIISGNPRTQRGKADAGKRRMQKSRKIGTHTCDCSKRYYYIFKITGKLCLLKGISALPCDTSAPRRSENSQRRRR